MAKNRFAQPLYGKVIFIYETDLRMEQLSTVFDPSTYWVDVTDMDCEVGYIASFVEGVGLVFVPPTNEIPPTLEEVQVNRKAVLKVERDQREVSPVPYKDVMLDYDATSRDRLDSARRGLEKNGGTEWWTTASNTNVELTLEDLVEIDELARQRSRALHFKYNALKQYIDTLETIAEVEAVTFDMEIPEENPEDEGIVDETLVDEANNEV